MNVIFIVFGEHGEYSMWEKYPLRAFRSELGAQAFILELTAERDRLIQKYLTCQVPGGEEWCKQRQVETDKVHDQYGAGHRHVLYWPREWTLWDQISYAEHRDENEATWQPVRDDMQTWLNPHLVEDTKYSYERVRFEP